MNGGLQQFFVCNFQIISLVLVQVHGTCNFKSTLPCCEPPLSPCIAIGHL